MWILNTSWVLNIRRTRHDPMYKATDNIEISDVTLSYFGCRAVSLNLFESRWNCVCFCVNDLFVIQGAGRLLATCVVGTAKTFLRAAGYVRRTINLKAKKTEKQ